MIKAPLWGVGWFRETDIILVTGEVIVFHNSLPKMEILMCASSRLVFQGGVLDPIEIVTSLFWFESVTWAWPASVIWVKSASII